MCYKKKKKKQASKQKFLLHPRAYFILRQAVFANRNRRLRRNRQEERRRVEHLARLHDRLRLRRLKVRVFVVVRSSQMRNQRALLVADEDGASASAMLGGVLGVKTSNMNKQTTKVTNKQTNKLQTNKANRSSHKNKE
jgi:hypothetical protein